MGNSLAKEGEKMRNSSFELLRIVAMFAMMLLKHFRVHGPDYWRIFRLSNWARRRCEIYSHNGVVFCGEEGLTSLINSKSLAHQ